MSSPVENILRAVITFDRKNQRPVYLQIADQISEAIAQKKIQPNTKLPGSRSLADILEIHRKTAIAVYDELQDLGLIEILPNKGTFIKSKLNYNHYKKHTPKDIKFSNHTPFSYKKSTILDNPFTFSSCTYAFNDGLPDYRIFRPALLSGYYSTKLKSKQNQKKTVHYNAEGSEFFKTQFAQYLNSTRGLNVSPENLLITRSTEMTVYILSELLLSPQDIVVVGHLSYFAVNMIFQKNGAKILTIPVDGQGINPEALEELCKFTKVRMLYLTSHYHYPTTVTLSLERRRKILELSEIYGFIIIEDDYDYDFQYEKGSFLPMASEDYTGSVIYIGSFGKTLAPGFRTGFAVSSSEFIVEMKKYLGIIDKQGDIVMEQALGEIIREGEIDRHLRKSLQIYRTRRDFFAETLDKFLGSSIRFQKPKGGTAFWLEWKNAVNLVKISDICEQNGLFIPKTLLYQNKNLCAMRVGFAHLTEDEALCALEIFSDAAKAVSKS